VNASVVGGSSAVIRRRAKEIHSNSPVDGGSTTTSTSTPQTNRPSFLERTTDIDDTEKTGKITTKVLPHPIP